MVDVMLFMFVPYVENIYLILFTPRTNWPLQPLSKTGKSHVKITIRLCSPDIDVNYRLLERPNETVY
jgi:hypothetical protein